MKATNDSYLKPLRQAAGITQRALASSVGVSVRTIQAIEQGRPPGALAPAIGNALVAAEE